MSYKFPNTFSKVRSLVFVRNWRFARLMDWINSLLDMIFRVSFIFSQSSMLSTTDLGLPSGVVMNSMRGNFTVIGIITTPFSVSLTKDEVSVNYKVATKNLKLKNNPSTSPYSHSDSPIYYGFKKQAQEVAMPLNWHHLLCHHRF